MHKIPGNLQQLERSYTVRLHIERSYRSKIRPTEVRMSRPNQQAWILGQSSARKILQSKHGPVLLRHLYWRCTFWY